jgi:hypothetical protein
MRNENEMYNEDSFYAVNKLVEFAQGDTIQKQMTQSMNETIANMRIPGVDNPIWRTSQKSEEKEQHED